MKIVLTGSLGHIGKPLAQQLVQQGHQVTVITSKNERKKDIEALGAFAALGVMEDAGFLAQTFTGADIVYLMETLDNAGGFFGQNINYLDAIAAIATNYKHAVEAAGIKKVVHLSSIGGHMASGNGMLAFHYLAEGILRQLPNDVAIKTMRPVGFYYNMLGFIATIKATGKIISNYKATYKEPWVSTDDIAKVVAEEMNTPFEGRTMRYIASDELSADDIARTLGQAIGLPTLQWVKISDEEQEQQLVKIGMNPAIAKGLVEMNAARQTGVLFEDYNANKPILSSTKLTDFVAQFVAAYNQQ